MEQFADWERGIFRYHNGIEEVWGDPNEIFETVAHLLGCHPNEALAQTGSFWARQKPDGTAEYGVDGPTGLPALEARRKFREAVDMAFQLAPFDPATGVGTTDTIRWAAWNALGQFNQKKSPNTGAWPTSS